MSWLDDLVNKGKDSVAQAWTDFQQAGVPALTASAEKYAADLLNKQAAEASKTASSAIQDILKRPTEPGGIGDYVKKELQNPIVKQYGGIAVGGAVAIGVVALLLFSRKGA